MSKKAVINHATRNVTFEQDAGAVRVTIAQHSNVLRAPSTGLLSLAEYEALFNVLDAVPQATALKMRETAARETHAERAVQIEELTEERDELRRTLRIFRDFVNNGATQWKMGMNHHPMWAHVIEALGEENNRRPTQKEWAFIWPSNTEPLERE